MKNKIPETLKLLSVSTVTLFLLFCFAGAGFAAMDTVEEAGPKYKVATKPAEEVFIKKVYSKDSLVSSAMAGYTQGVDSNPFLDSSHKADSYSQEIVDMRFKFPVPKTIVSSTDAKFGFNITNTNYYAATDVNTFDATIDAGIEQEIFRNLSMATGYIFETLWYPRDENGTYYMNEVFSGFKHLINDLVYQRLMYRAQFRNYAQRDTRAENGNLTDKLRADFRSVLEHELTARVTDTTKVKIRNQFSFNSSNFKYLDYYDYFAYRVGGSITQLITKRLSNVTGLYYQRKNYSGRVCTDKNKEEKDNLYTLSTTLMYDVTKSVSIYANYSHTENHSNEPTERYSDNLFSFGMYYSF